MTVCVGERGRVFMCVFCASCLSKSVRACVMDFPTSEISVCMKCIPSIFPVVYTIHRLACVCV